MRQAYPARVDLVVVRRQGKPAPSTSSPSVSSVQTEHET
jgi:hypothetical protein